MSIRGIHYTLLTIRTISSILCIVVARLYCCWQSALPQWLRSATYMWPLEHVRRKTSLFLFKIGHHLTKVPFIQVKCSLTILWSSHAKYSSIQLDSSHAKRSTWQYCGHVIIITDRSLITTNSKSGEPNTHNTLVTSGLLALYTHIRLRW